MMMMISANNLIALYMGLELQSLALYVLAAINRDSARASEAGLKYFVLGALSSGMLLYGSSLVYGFTGSTAFPQIAESLAAHGAGVGLIFGLVFIIAGLAFKISAVPFHMWTPDVYEGAPTPVTAFFAAAPKVAAMALLVRTMVGPFGHVVPDWQQIIVFVSIASMALGAFAAIGQTNIKRLLAYSSIGNMGYALVGLAAGTRRGRAGRRRLHDDLHDHDARHLRLRPRHAPQGPHGRGDQRSRGPCAQQQGPRLRACHADVLAGRHSAARRLLRQVFRLPRRREGRACSRCRSSASSPSVVGAYYYLRIVKIIYFDEPAERFDDMDGEVRLVAYASGAFILLFVLFANPLIDLAAQAAQSLY